MFAARVVLAVVGIALLLFGASQLLAKVPPPILVWLVLWLVAVWLVHQLVVAPAVVGVGWLLRRRVAPRPRRYLQFGLITAAMTTPLAVLLIIRRGSQPPAKAMLEQDYALHWVLLLAGIAVVSVLVFLVRRRPAVPD